MRLDSVRGHVNASNFATGEFDAAIRRLTLESPNARPFLCHGLPWPADAMLVGLNPGSGTPFWPYWNADTGCDKAAWLADYLKRHGRFGPTRKRIELLFRELEGYRCVECNLFAAPSRRLSDLPAALRSTALFDYLLETIRPRLVFVHGSEAVRHLRDKLGIALTSDSPEPVNGGNWRGIVYATRHLSYRWSDAGVVALGRTLRAILTEPSGERRG